MLHSYYSKIYTWKAYDNNKTSGTSFLSSTEMIARFRAKTEILAQNPVLALKAN